VLALRHLENGRVEAVQDCLRQTFESSGLPDAMLMDHGTPWWNANSPWGWTELTVGLMRQGIRIYLSGIRHPQTQGKVERMHGVLHTAIRKRKADADQQLWLDEFREEYNTLRPHESLGMKTPACFWTPSLRAWQADPPEWEYPASMKVVRTQRQRGDQMAEAVLDHQRRTARSTRRYRPHRGTGAGLFLQDPAPRTGSEFGERRDITD
jgi:hypothetical protein